MTDLHKLIDDYEAGRDLGNDVWRGVYCRVHELAEEVRKVPYSSTRSITAKRLRSALAALENLKENDNGN